MKTKNIFAVCLSCLVLLFTACQKSGDLNLIGDCQITALALNDIDGVIDPIAKTIVITVDKDYDRSLMTVTRLEISEGAICDLTIGDELNMLSARTLCVTNNDARQLWQLSVQREIEKVENPKAIYMGLAATFTELNIEEQTACQWLLDNVEGSTYASLAEIANGTVNLKECKVIWWHLHKDGGIDGRGAFESNAPDALTAAARLKGYYQQGGSLFLTRYATYLPAFLGETECFPNNCWGGYEQDAETVNDPWSFFATGLTDHPLYANIITDGVNPECVYTCDAGYRITNSTAQYHIGADWGGYADYDVWRAATGAKPLGFGGDGAIVAWEYERTDAHGGIVCIGSGCYDWYSVASVTENYHKNIAIITENAINYLTK